MIKSKCLVILFLFISSIALLSCSRVNQLNRNVSTSSSKNVFALSSATEQNHYIVPGASGSGSSWSSPYGALPDNLIRGHTYYLADGTYSRYTFDDPESDNLYITVKKATIQDHGTNTGWNDSYGDGVATFSNGSPLLYFRTGRYVIDGQTGGGPGSWDTGHGIRLIVYGTTGYGIRLGESQSGGYNQPDNFIIKHLDIGGLDNANKGYRLFYNWAGGKTIGTENIEIINCYLHDCQRSNLFLMFAKNVLIEYTMFTRNTSTPEHHGSSFADRGTDDLILRYCYFLDITGTAYVDVKKNEDQTHQNWKIYGNIFAVTEGNPYGCGIGGNGSIGMTTTSTGWCHDFYIYNNSFVNCKGLNTGIYFPLGENIQVYNNVWYSCDKINNVGLITYQYNHYLDTEMRNSLGIGDVLGSGDPFVDWRNRNLYLKQAIGNSKDLYDGINRYNIDMNGIRRGVDGEWDRGALEFVSSVDTEPPSIPSNLRAERID